jgi:hypothetical protein
MIKVAGDAGSNSSKALDSKDLLRKTLKIKNVCPRVQEFDRDDTVRICAPCFVDNSHPSHPNTTEQDIGPNLLRKTVHDLLLSFLKAQGCTFDRYAIKFMDFVK